MVNVVAICLRTGANLWVIVYLEVERCADQKGSLIIGRDMPAVGFSIGVELLLDNITEENQGEIEEIILEQDNEIEAVRKAILSTQKGKEIKFKYKD